MPILSPFNEKRTNIYLSQINDIMIKVSLLQVYSEECPPKKWYL